MRTIFTLFVLLLLGAQTTFAQTEAKPITVFYHGSSKKYLYEGEKLTYLKFRQIAKGNVGVTNMLRSAKRQSSVSQVFGCIGGFVLGYQLGYAIVGKEVNYVLLGIGAGCIAVSIPLSMSSDSKMDRAVDVYNSGFNDAYYRKPKMSLSLGSSPNGLGLCLNF